VPGLLLSSKDPYKEASVLSSHKLRNTVSLMAGAGIAAFVWGNVQVAAVFMIADLVLMGLLFANTEDKINLQVHNLFDDNVQVNEYIAPSSTSRE
jgi:hypothetical protein